jgi:hypothetical protein
LLYLDGLVFIMQVVPPESHLILLSDFIPYQIGQIKRCFLFMPALDGRTLTQSSSQLRHIGGKDFLPGPPVMRGHLLYRNRLGHVAIFYSHYPPSIA